MKLQRLRIWGIKDGQRIYVDQQGPVLTLDPEVVSIREAEDVEVATKEYVDQIIDVWKRGWGTDKRMQEWADAWNKHDKGEIPVLRTAQEQREMYQHTLDTNHERTFMKLDEEDIAEYQRKIALSDEELSAEAQRQYDYSLERYNQVYDIAYMRNLEYDEFMRECQGPPSHWDSIESYVVKTNYGQTELDQMNARYEGRAPERKRSYEQPAEIKLCRECLKPCQWIWYSCFPGPLCGSAGWVAICEPCKSWHKELTCVIS